jgi:L-amino acid N-acyltransferase YncA
VILGPLAQAPRPPLGVDSIAVLIRHADADRDAATIAAIYAPSVREGVASLEEVVPEPRQIAERIGAITRSWPWLVAVVDDEVVGYAYGSQHRERASYRWSADVTVYVSTDHHRRGIGRALYEPLLSLLAAQGYHEACAGITVPNDASVGLHEALGFVPVGIYRDIAFKLGVWRSVGWWQKTLREHRPGERPPEIGPPPRLD